MPKMKVFVIYDAKVEAYLQPFYARTNGEALRMWEQSVNDEKTQFYRHPQDFALYGTAEYNEDNGRFEQYDTMVPLGLAIEIKKQSA